MKLIPSVDENTEQLELSYITGGNVKSYNPMENSLDVSLKVKHPLYNTVTQHTGFSPRDTKPAYTKSSTQCSQQLYLS